MSVEAMNLFPCEEGTYPISCYGVSATSPSTIRCKQRIAPHTGSRMGTVQHTRTAWCFPKLSGYIHFIKLFTGGWYSGPT